MQYQPVSGEKHFYYVNGSAVTCKIISKLLVYCTKLCILLLRTWLAVASALHKPWKGCTFWLHSEIGRNVPMEENVTGAEDDALEKV